MTELLSDVTVFNEYQVNFKETFFFLQLFRKWFGKIRNKQNWHGNNHCKYESNLEKHNIFSFFVTPIPKKSIMKCLVLQRNATANSIWHVETRWKSVSSKSLVLLA